MLDFHLRSSMPCNDEARKKHESRMTKRQAESVRRLIVSHSVAWSFGFRSHENFIQVMLSSMNTIADIQTLYARLGERDYEAVMSYLADDIAWIVADNSPLADCSPYRGIAGVRSGVFERLTAGFDKLVFDADEIFECNGGERVVALGYYYFRFQGQAEELKAQVAHVWTIRDGRAVKFQQYLDTLQVARDAGAV